VDSHGLRVDVRLERVERVREIRECVCHDVFLKVSPTNSRLAKRQTNYQFRQFAQAIFPCAWPSGR